MNKIFSYVANMLGDRDGSRSDFQLGSAIFDLLGTSSAPKIQQALQKIESLGLDLRLIGPLALITNHKQIADVLMNSFGIKIEEYLTKERVSEYDKGPGYPYLAALAFHSFNNDFTLQKRALKWGANPSAEWDVDNRMGAYGDGKEKRIGWIGENILRLNRQMVESLCEHEAAAPGPLAQSIRANALYDSIAHHTGRMSHDFKTMFDLFRPGGIYAFTCSPWEIDRDGKSLALINTVNHSQHNQHVDSGKCRDLVEKWAMETASGHGGQCMRIAVICAQNKSSTCFPQWVVDHLSPAQAQAALKKGWEKAFGEWSCDSSGALSSSRYTGAIEEDCASHNLKRYINQFHRLTEVATAAPCENGMEAPDFLIGSLSAYQIKRFTVQSLDALVMHYPRFSNSLDINKCLQPVRELLSEFAEKKGKPNEIAALDEKLVAVIDAHRLRGSAAEASAKAHAENGTVSAPPRVGPRL